MKTTLAAIVAAVAIILVTLHLSVNQRSAEDVLKLGVGTIYRSFTPERPALESIAAALEHSRNTGPTRPVRLLGSARSVERRAGATYFMLESGGASVHVSYSGVVPPTFTEGGAVVVTGVIDSEGKLSAFGLEARVPRSGS